MVQNNFCSTCTICDMGQPPHPSGQVTFACHLPRDKFCKKYLSDPVKDTNILTADRTAGSAAVCKVGFASVVKTEKTGFDLKLFKMLLLSMTSTTCFNYEHDNYNL